MQSVLRVVRRSAVGTLQLQAGTSFSPRSWLDKQVASVGQGRASTTTVQHPVLATPLWAGLEAWSSIEHSM